MTVAAILKHKGHEVATVRPTMSIAEVAKLLTERGIGAAPVMDADGQLLGIVSERDIIRALAAEGSAALARSAGELMTRALRTITPDTTIERAMEMMTAGRVRHLPVMDGLRMVGIVSIGDVVKARIMQQEHEVDSLKAYVAGAA